MLSLGEQWKTVNKSTSEVDLTFLLLRVFSLAAGITWLLVAPLAVREKEILITALIFFLSYSLLCYLIIFFKPGLIKKIYLVSLFLDAAFLSNLIHTETSFAGSFFLGFYLLISLHTIYFGLYFGLGVALLSTACYLLSISHLLNQVAWTDLAVRIGFFFFITVPVGLLTEKVKKDKEKVENFNKTLEIQVAQRTDKIKLLLDQEMYLREILGTVAHINKLLITTPNVLTLVEKSCARFIQHGHYGFCWIGLLEADKIQTVYSSDNASKYLADPPYALVNHDEPFAKSQTAQCIRDNKTIISKHDPKKPDPTPWRNPGEVKGFHSVISLPLRASQAGAPLGALTIYTWRMEGFEPEEIEMLDELAGDIGFAIDSFRQKEAVTALTAERTANYEETIYSFVDMIEQRDTYTAGHTERVAHYCELIANEMGVDKGGTEKLYKAATLHDIGKIATPDSVLLKPGKLTKLDYDLIKLHASAGFEMLSKIEMYKELAVIIRHHHEKHDGSGYPDGLKGEEIPLLSRIIAVGDAFDAMTTNRIYKARQEIPAALEELKTYSGSQFHPEIVNAALKVLADIKISTTINQLPSTDLEKKRFSYFFNDKLTGFYNEDYLKIILNNLDLNQNKCLHIIHLLNVPEYNKRLGWAQGNLLLKEFAAELPEVFPDALIFRAYGNDFAAISKAHLPIDADTLNALPSIANTEIMAEIDHVDLLAGKSYSIDKLERLEIIPADVCPLRN